MLRAATRSVLGHKLRLVLTSLAIILGVAFVSGTFILTDAMKQTFNAIADAGNSDVYVRGVADKTAVADANGNQRTQLPITEATAIKAVPGVQAVYPQLQGAAILIGKNGKAAVNGGAPPLGFAWDANPKSWVLLSGRAPTSASEVAVLNTTLSLAHLKVGDSTKVVVGNQVLPVTIVGDIGVPGGAGLAGATATFFDPASAQTYYAPDGQVPSFAVNAQPGVSPATLSGRLASAVPQDNVLTGTQLAAETKKDLDNGVLKIFKIFFLVFAFIAVFVGAFVILNTFSMLVAQRTRELALLRALGASRRQVTQSVLVEAFLVGTFSSAVGLGAGALIAAALKALLSTFGLKIDSALPIGLWTVIWSFAVGILVTLVAAYFPARRAARIPPVAAMRDDVAMPARSLKVRAGVGLGMLVIGVAVLIFGLSGKPSHSGLVTGVGAALTVLAVTVLAPILAPPVLGVLGAPLAAVWRTSGKLARANAIRNPRRSAATASALMIGLALVTGVTVIAQSTKANFAKVAGSDLTAQYAILAAGQSEVPAAVATQARTVPGVAHVAEYAGLPIEVGGDIYGATAVDGTDIVAAQHVDISAGSASSLNNGQILVSSKLAKAKHWSVGQTIQGKVATKAVPITIGGIYTNNQILGDVTIPLAWYDAAVPVDQRSDGAIAIVTTSGHQSAAVVSALEKITKPYVILSVKTKAQYIKDQQGQLNILLAILYALLGLAVVIAIFGIVNTLALSVFERTREIGLLRAVGMGRRQLRRVIRLESVAISLFGALMGVVLGLFFGIAVQQALKSDGLNTLSIPVGSIIVFLILAAIAGIFAAIWPALRASRLDVLKAITTE